MSLNILNRKFLALLCKIGIDINSFPDKTFDGLFERRQNELNYFLEWFVDNVTHDNALTESETDIYQYLKGCNNCLTDEELSFALTKCIPSYEDLELIDENFIDNCLSCELEVLDDEYQKLLTINLDLEEKYRGLKKKPNDLKEECNRTKKKLDEVKDEFQKLNSYFNSMNDEINNLRLHNFHDVIDIVKFKSLCEEMDQLMEKFTRNNFHHCQLVSFLSETDKMTKLKRNLATSKFCSIVSKSLVVEVGYKISRAEEFLNKLGEESDSHFTFEEVFNDLFDLNDVKTVENITEEINAVQKDLVENFDRECELTWNYFLSQHYMCKLCESNENISKYLKFMKLIKLDLVNNIFLQQVLNKSKRFEMENADLINDLHSSLNKNLSSIKSNLDSISCRSATAQDHMRNLNEKHSLLMQIKKIDVENSLENITRNCSSLRLLMVHPSFYSAELLEKLGKEICSSASIVLCGPTNQIQMTSVEVQWAFSNSDRIIAENSHSIQRLLTEYVNTKEAVSTSNRRQSLLWIDFLVKPEILTSGLEELQKKSLKCSSKINEFSKT